MEVNWTKHIIDGDNIKARFCRLGRCVCFLLLLLFFLFRLSLSAFCFPSCFLGTAHLQSTIMAQHHGKEGVKGSVFIFLSFSFLASLSSLDILNRFIAFLYTYLHALCVTLFFLCSTFFHVNFSPILVPFRDGCPFLYIHHSNLKKRPQGRNTVRDEKKGGGKKRKAVAALSCFIVFHSIYIYIYLVISCSQLLISLIHKLFYIWDMLSLKRIQPQNNGRRDLPRSALLKGVSLYVYKLQTMQAGGT